jgi:hypothetical protein
MADDIVLGAKQIRNPKGITPHWDTEGDIRPVNPVGRDISNTKTFPTGPTHERYSADPFEMHGIRSDTPRNPIGHGVPKDHPAIVSEN